MLHRKKKWQSVHTVKRLKSLATVGYLSSNHCVCVRVCVWVGVCVQHQEPNLLRNIWFKVFTGMQMGWKHLDRHVSKNLLNPTWFNEQKACLLWNRTDNTQKLHVSDPPLGWGTTNTKVKKRKQKKKQMKRTAIHHNTSHPWFMIQAQVSVIQHCGEPPGSSEARVKLHLKAPSFRQRNDNQHVYTNTV